MTEELAAEIADRWAAAHPDTLFVTGGHLEVQLTEEQFVGLVRDVLAEAGRAPGTPDGEPSDQDIIDTLLRGKPNPAVDKIVDALRGVAATEATTKPPVSLEPPPGPPTQLDTPDPSPSVEKARRMLADPDGYFAELRARTDEETDHA
jgi:hypothetical protein